ncbi:MAG: hypothetical protein J2P21_05890 [Chloracidobacterium sp.]|nr:hypothetical protein [Chloracidobacterium sp.]
MKSELLAILIVGSTIVHALDRQLGDNFLTVVPRGESSQNVPNNGYGIGIPILFLTVPVLS